MKYCVEHQIALPIDFIEKSSFMETMSNTLNLSGLYACSLCNIPLLKKKHVERRVRTNNILKKLKLKCLAIMKIATLGGKKQRIQSKL